MLTPPIEGQFYARVDDFGVHYDNGGVLTKDINDANVITSLVADQPLVAPRDTDANVFASRMKHKVVVDIDYPCVLIPSSTPGHFHLIIDKAMDAEVYFDLLENMAAAGIVEEGYADASRDQGRSAVRLPWIKKGAPSEIATAPQSFNPFEDVLPL